MNRPRPCWAPKGVRPEVAHQLIREFTYLYGAVCPKDGASVFLILPAADTECFQIFINALAKKYSRSHVLVFVDGAGNHISGDLMVPGNITLSPLPAHSPELYEAHYEMWRRAKHYRTNNAKRRLIRHILTNLKGPQEGHDVWLV